MDSNEALLRGGECPEAECIEPAGHGHQSWLTRIPAAIKKLRGITEKANSGPWVFKFMQGAPWSVNSGAGVELLRARYAGPNSVDLANAQLATLGPYTLPLMEALWANPPKQHAQDATGSCQWCTVLRDLTTAIERLEA